VFKDRCLENMSGIITGGTSGIGFEVAKVLISLGARVTITGRDQDKMEHAANALGPNAFGLIGDVRKSSSVEENVAAHLARFGSLDFLMNNAAGNFLCPLEQMTENGFRSVVDIVLHGTFLFSKAAFPHLKKSKGLIVNTGTTYVEGPAAWVAHSGAAKAGVMNLTKSMALEWGRYGIRCNMIAPGPVEGTEGVKRLMASPMMKDRMNAYLPLGRMAKGSEIGELITFLLKMPYITGAVIPIDGGFHLTTPGLIPAEFLNPTS
jgi:NAD(P)-dependent dehydrogenase (short-subunit alcohol dehydrogenase family)